MTRLRADGTTSLQSFSLEEVLNVNTDVELMAEDIIQVLDKRNYVDRATVKVSGEVRNPASYTIDDALTIQASTDLSNGLTKEARCGVRIPLLT